MKLIGLVFALMTFSTGAFAGEYFRCQGQDQKGKPAQIELAFESILAAVITDLEGDELNRGLCRHDGHIKNLS